MNNTNIIINGSSPAGTAGDTDNLDIRGTDPASGGTSGNEDVIANFAAAGGPLTPIVRVYDAGIRTAQVLRFFRRWRILATPPVSRPTCCTTCRT